MVIERYIPSGTKLPVDFSFNLHALLFILIPLLLLWGPVLLDHLFIIFACIFIPYHWFPICWSIPAFYILHEISVHGLDASHIWWSLSFPLPCNVSPVIQPFWISLRLEDCTWKERVSFWRRCYCGKTISPHGNEMLCTGGGPLVNVRRRITELEESARGAPEAIFESNGSYVGGETLCSRRTLWVWPWGKLCEYKPSTSYITHNKFPQAWLAG